MRKISDILRARGSSMVRLIESRRACRVDAAHVDLRDRGDPRDVRDFRDFVWNYYHHRHNYSVY